MDALHQQRETQAPLCTRAPDQSPDNLCHLKCPPSLTVTAQMALSTTEWIGLFSIKHHSNNHRIVLHATGSATSELMFVLVSQ